VVLGFLGISLLTAGTLQAQAPAWLKPGAEAVHAQVLAWRRDIHAHPELGNRETRTGNLVADQLAHFGIATRRIALTGVVGVLKGGRPGPVVALRADMDALPIQETVEVPWKSTVPGVMHACGHDAHTAMLLGAAKLLADHRAELRGTVVFLFQPAEEGAPAGEFGGARRMIAEGALNNPKVDAVYGLHQRPENGTGSFGWRIRPMMSGRDTWRITLHGKMTHGARPPPRDRPVLVAAEAIQALQAIRSRRLDPMKPFVLSVGTIHGGNRHNIIADTVELTGTMRTFEPTVRERAMALMHDTLKGVCAVHGGSYELSFQPDHNPPVDNDPRLAAAVKPLLADLGPVLEQEQIMGAEDFAHYQRQVPGFFLFLNTGKGPTGGNHTPTMNLDEEALKLGVAALAGMAWGHADPPR